METEMSSFYYSESTPSLEYGSSSGSNDPSRRATHSDEEEIMLASRHPKKRAGRTKFKETRHPIYRGVRRRNNNKWVCELREPNKKSRIWLGTYSNPEMAARAHDVAALALRGHMACLNFADSVWRLPRPASTSVADIQKAEAAAAEEFRSPVSSPSPSPLAQKSSTTSTSTNSETFDIERTIDVNDEFEEHAPRVDYNYMDEEAVFDMPGLLVSMAEGLLLSPPSLVPGCMREESHGFGWDANENGTDEMSLWSYSFLSKALL